MKTPAVVVFDLGKVLVDFDYRIASEKIAGKSKVSANEVLKLLDHAPLLYRFETGLLTPREFYAEVCARTGFFGTLEEFTVYFADIFCEIKSMISLHAGLRAAGVPTFIFSNTNEIAVAHIRRHFPFFANFDGYIFSYEHGSMKPDSKIYEVVESQCGHRGEAVLYLDDRAENVAGGAARGWQALLHQNPEETRIALQTLGLPVK